MAAGNVAIHAEFAGTATVSIEWFMNGGWREMPDYADLTTSFSYVYEGPTVPIRLNCTAYTNDVVYSMVSA